VDQKNTRLLLAARPDGLPRPEDWALSVLPCPVPEKGTMLVRNRHISIDPAMRGWMRGGPGYLGPLEVGDVMQAWTVAEVVGSRCAGFAEGDVVTGAFGVQDYAVSDGSGVRTLDVSQVPGPSHLGVLGMTGITAHLALHHVAAARPGDTVLVSAAAGAVGNVVGQLARILGCRVVGIAGGAAKARYLVDELGFDAVVDRHGPDLAGRLRAEVPDGVDVYVDNVGGALLGIVLGLLAEHARVALCGAISRYNGPDGQDPAVDLLPLLVRRATMTGFLVLEETDLHPAAVADLTALRAAGRLRDVQDVVHGTVGDFPGALLRLFRGDNIGKTVLTLG
jgi:NADPH-dependent curcumin reductase CurA